MPQTKLTHTLGYDVNKQLRVRNDLAGFLQELSRHNAQGVDGAGRLRRELENRRRAGRNGTREKTRGEHRDERNSQYRKLARRCQPIFLRVRELTVSEWLQRS